MPKIVSDLRVRLQLVLNTIFRDSKILIFDLFCRNETYESNWENNFTLTDEYWRSDVAASSSFKFITFSSISLWDILRLEFRSFSALFSIWSSSSFKRQKQSFWGVLCKKCFSKLIKTHRIALMPEPLFQ